MSRAASNKKVAVVLAGCGVYDGSEIQEAVFTLNALSKKSVEFMCFAPNVPQMHVIDHTQGEPMDGETRNVLTESARICRGKIADLKHLAADSAYDAVIFPGGFGAAKNLCDLAVKGPEVTLNSEVERVVKDFHANGKPMGFCCIAPGIVAKALEGKGVEVTMGGETEGEEWPYTFAVILIFWYAGTCGAVKALGGTHVEKPLAEAHVDGKNKVVTSAAYMCGTAAIHEIEESVVAMVDKTVGLI
eukprot:g7673.t1